MSRPSLLPQGRSGFKHLRQGDTFTHPCVSSRKGGVDLSIQIARHKSDLVVSSRKGGVDLSTGQAVTEVGDLVSSCKGGVDLSSGIRLNHQRRKPSPPAREEWI